MIPWSSKRGLSILAVGLLLNAGLVFVLTTDQPMIKLARFIVFNSFRFEGDEIGLIERDLVYKTVDGQRLMVDLYLPLERRAARSPVVVFSHGGGWVTGDRDTMLIGPDNRQLIVRLRRLGYAVANFEYRLLGEDVTLSDTIADHKDIVRWLRASAADHQLDPANIGLWGQSAGGFLVLMTGLTEDYEFPGAPVLRGISPQVSYIVDNYGSTNLVERFGPIASGRASPGLLDRRRMDFMFPATYEEAPDAFSEGLVELSPIMHVDEEDPPVLIVHGDADGLVPLQQSLILQTRLEAAGATHELHVVANADHAFNGATPEQIEEIVEMTVRFITRNTLE